ncbi:master replication initiator protein [Sophora yellow stunt virus]|uniref:Master replication protein n=1 Tax=Sophora yellow stunt virus TaxID=1980160 RepID=A0A2S0U3H8_9VIRU|nr:master replication initiator protein [Sophora yellow stunt virus]AWB36049.1 master replication initiator protein [Sophora yellow stunt virus]WGT79560.1 master replication initiator protein [Sophora yellow stunt virus]WGT79576.1 master replication initiator protein [Sophora yellow stunt virus]WGT79584.1 master replication initiator protein [Sophora yellow stunt virus]
MSRSVICWCFTINNPSSPLSLHETMKYMVYQLEEGENGTRHFQGYVEMKKRTTLNQMKRLFPTAHLEKRKGTQSEARAYCMKQDSRVEGPWEYGEFKITIEDKLQAVMQDMKTSGKRPRDYLEDCPNAYDKSKETLKEYYGQMEKKKAMESWELQRKPWMDEVEALLETKDCRRIIWVYGPQGGEGKTTYAKHLFKTRDAFYTTGGKTGDIAFAWDHEPLVLFDIPRSCEEYVNYGIIEQLKNGMVQSGKYTSCIKIKDYVEVIVFANFTPRSGMLSEDRIVIVEAS